jgi:phosphomannomutase
MLHLLKDLRKKVAIGFVGGSDLSKILEQLGPNGLKDMLSSNALLSCS